MAIAYPGDPLRYGFGPEHRWIPPWQMNLEAAVREAAAEHPIQVPDTDAQTSNPETPDAGIVGDLLKGGALLTGGLTLNKLLGNPLGGLAGLVKSSFGGAAVTPTLANVPIDRFQAEDAAARDLPEDVYTGTPVPNYLYGDPQWLQEVALNQPAFYQDFYTGMYPDNELIRAQPGGGGPDFPFDLGEVQQGSAWDEGGFRDINWDEYGPQSQQADAIGGAGFDAFGGAIGDTLGGLPPSYMSGVEGAGGLPYTTGMGADTGKLFGFDVANPVVDTLGGLAAIYGAVKDPNPYTILQGAGGVAAAAQLLPGFGTAYGLYNGIIAGMKWLTGAGDKVPWGGAVLPISGGNFGQLEANAGYGGQDIAAKLADKAAKVQAELQTMASAQGVDLKSLLGPLGTAAVQFQPTGTREQPDADRPMVRIVTTSYNDRGSPQDEVVGVINTARGEVDDPKVIAAQLLQSLTLGRSVTLGNDNRYAEGGVVMPEKQRATERAIGALMEALGISRREAQALLRGSIKDTDVDDFAKRMQRDAEEKSGRSYKDLMRKYDQGVMTSPYFGLGPMTGMEDDASTYVEPPPRLPPELRELRPERKMRGAFAEGGFVGEASPFWEEEALLDYVARKQRRTPSRQAPKLPFLYGQPEDRTTRPGGDYKSRGVDIWAEMLGWKFARPDDTADIMEVPAKRMNRKPKAMTEQGEETFTLEQNLSYAREIELFRSLNAASRRAKELGGISKEDLTKAIEAAEFLNNENNMPVLLTPEDLDNFFGMLPKLNLLGDRSVTRGEIREMPKAPSSLWERLGK